MTIDPSTLTLAALNQRLSLALRTHHNSAEPFTDVARHARLDGILADILDMPPVKYRPDGLKMFVTLMDALIPAINGALGTNHAARWGTPDASSITFDPTDPLQPLPTDRVSLWPGSRAGDTPADRYITFLRERIDAYPHLDQNASFAQHRAVTYDQLTQLTGRDNTGDYPTSAQLLFEFVNDVVANLDPWPTPTPITTQEGNTMTDTTTPTDDTGDGPSEAQYIRFLRTTADTDHAKTVDGWDALTELGRAHYLLCTLTGHTPTTTTQLLVDQLVDEFLDDILANLEATITGPDPRDNETPAEFGKRLLRLAEDHASEPARASIYLDIYAHLITKRS